MNTRSAPARSAGLTVVGILLLVVGIGWFALRELQIDPFDAIADAGWPFFVILPGLALLATGFVLGPPRGLGFAIAGAIVTAVGSALFYQQATGHWESWAYAWALVGPGAAGLAMLVFGLIFREPNLVSVGTRMVVISAAIFIVGYWFFETIFATGQAPFDLAGWWPFALVLIGLAILAAGLLDRGRSGGDHPGEAANTG